MSLLILEACRLGQLIVEACCVKLLIAEACCVELLECGAAVDARNAQTGETALHAAASSEACARQPDRVPLVLRPLLHRELPQGLRRVQEDRG